MKKIFALIVLLCGIQKLNAQALAANVNHTDVTCNSACNGAATAVPSGGTSPYTYVWAPGGQTTTGITGLCPGNYTVTVTDATSATVTATCTITQPPVLAFTFSTTQSIQCNGGYGSATAIVTGGTPSYTYSWSGNAMPYAFGPSITNAPAASYTLTVVDANGCSVVHVLVLTQPTALTSTLSFISATCGNPNGTATCYPSGGTAPYAYYWNTNPVQTTQTATGLTSATYTCTVTDANGCSYSNNVFVPTTSNPTVTISVTNSTCNASCDATMIANSTGGNGPYTCLWSPTSQTNPSLTNVCPGTYTATVTDNLGCVGTATATVTQPTAISIATSSTPLMCNTFGTATANPSGGTPPYTYNWNSTPVQTTQTATGLMAGAYTVTVTDANNCQSTAIVNVTNVPGPSASITSSTNVSCFGGNDGSATVTAFGGTTPYTYLWSPSGATTATVTGIVAGNYTCTVTDANGCTATASVTITTPPQLVATISSFVPAGCNNSDGSATATATGGTPAYTYTWLPSSVSGATINNIPSLTTFTVYVTDVNGCMDSAAFTETDSCNYVWPGDANEDAVADNNDILAIGIANGATGTTRANATTNWIGQPSADWGQTFVSGTDYKFADCDGDGTIANADTNAVIQNFGFTHNMRVGNAPVYDATLPDLTITMNQPMVAAGSSGTLSVSLGNSSVPASNVYGVAFTLNFDQAQILSNSFGMSNSNCWMGTAGNNLMGVVLKQPNTSSVQVAITKFDHTNANGFGNIADLGFTTSSLLDNTGNMQNVNFTLSNVTIISANETPQTANLVNDSVTVADSSVMLGISNEFADQFPIFPNPANENVTIVLPVNFSGKSYEAILTDATGRIILQEHFTEQALNLDLTSVDNGIYFCAIRSDGKIAGVQKLIKE
ncbi:MAG TPA: T9SS type A sorting domain-containing protein [Bacteroidia bacterium]|jgi:hypothetical protein|nr:T9SS type A sorting domain-containing protein [Bacteroidia bacterium]